MAALHFRRIWPLLLAVVGSACLSACSSVGDSTRNALYAITPYKVEIVQGNFVSKQQVEALKTGMTRQQCREVLGTPLLNDVFHSNRWDYVFTIRRQGVEPQQRRLTLFFNGEVLDRFEGDPMPSEEEFVATLDTRSRKGSVPKLEASEDELKKYDPSKDAKAQEPAQPLPPIPPVYPPLESGR
ncbi:outer membrane protein assembly factor BamE [Variovorax sp. J22R133]|uniref:outer membrane protein assembly factor BamE n=1 Tax=Variovorax brevis TaxID=3053503 RepID=UPI002577FB0E|nr:outer membrane protein assembly factor BamE [Variovorax sp. J22R133]MDM0115516.1 outer membrane protein assembly factor BamE [Variovorax sp. J22R133]